MSSNSSSTFDDLQSADEVWLAETNTDRSRTNGHPGATSGGIDRPGSTKKR